MRYVRLLLALACPAILPAQTCQVTVLPPYSLPPNVENEPLSASRTLRITNPIPGPNGAIYFYDSYARLRRLDPNGTLTTVIGKSVNRPLSSGFVRVAPNGIVHAAFDNQIFQLRNRDLISIADTGPLRDFAFDPSGALYLLDTTNRLRKLESNGDLRTLATGLANATNIWPRADGSILISQIGVLQANGVLAPPPPTFLWPSFAAPDRTLYGITSPNTVATLDRPGTPVFSNYTGTPVAVTSDGDLLLIQRFARETRLFRFRNGTATLLATADTLATDPTQLPRILRAPNATYFSAASGLIKLPSTNLEAEPYAPIALGPNGSIFTVFDNRLTAYDSSGAITPVGTRTGQPIFRQFNAREVPRATLAWSADGYLYWHANAGTIGVWHAESQSTVNITAPDSAFLTTLPDGAAATWIGSLSRPRPNTLRRLNSASISAEVPAIPRAYISFAAPPFFTAGDDKLLRTTETGTVLYTLAELNLPFPPVITSMDPIPNGVLLAVRSGALELPLRIDNIDRCESIPVPAIAKGGIVNAANYLYNDALSSNSLLAIFGANFDTPAEFFTPTLFASPNQLLIQGPTLLQDGAIYPTPFNLEWTWRDIRFIDDNPLTYRLATPALFTANAAGTGPAAALNQDGSINTPTNPAAPGTIVQFFGAGFGATTPLVQPTELFSSTALTPLRNPAILRIGGRSAEIRYAGGAPGQRSSVYQINAVIPPGTPPGPQPIELVIANQTALSTAPVTIQVAPQ